MPKFSRRSMSHLEGCHPNLIRLFKTVVEEFDCTIIEGHRGEEKQNEMVELGRSQLKWPLSSHNEKPSKAVDVAPYPVDWEDRERFLMFGGYVLGIAKGLEVKIRWGGDWNRDTQVKDNRFDDLPHFELFTS